MGSVCKSVPNQDTLIKLGFSYNPTTGILSRNNIKCESQQPNGYYRVSINYERYMVHRIIFSLMGTDPDQLHVDHINGTRTDNRWSNLRLVTIRENHSNSLKHRNGKLLGAIKHKKRFKSKIYIDHKHVHLGYFNTALDAHHAYMEARKKLNEPHSA